MAVYLPRRWQRLPQRAGEIVAAIGPPLFLHVPANAGFDASGNGYAVTLNGADAAHKPDESGTCWRLNAGDATSSFAAIDGKALVRPAGTPLTVVVLFKTTDDYGPIFTARSSATDAPIFNMSVGYSAIDYGAGQLAFIARDDSGNLFFTGGGSGNVSDGKAHLAALRVSVANTLAWSLDGGAWTDFGGSFGGNVTCTADRVAYGADRRWIQDGFSSPDRRHLDCSILLGAGFRRDLSNAEIKSLWENLRRPFAPQGRGFVVGFAGAGGGGQALTPNLVTNNQTFYSLTVAPGEVALAPSLFSNSQTFYVPTVSATNTLTPGLLDNTATFFSPTIAPGSVDLSPALFTNTGTFFAATVAPGEVTLLLALLSNTSTFFGSTVASVAVTITPSLFTNSATFYAPDVSISYTLTPGLFSNAGSFFAPTVTPGAAGLLPGLYSNASTFFSPVVDLAGSQNLAPARLDNASTFFSATITLGTVLVLPSLLTNTSTFFAPVVAPGAVTIAPLRLDNMSVFFLPVVEQGAGPVELLPTLYTNVQEFFQASVLPGEATIFLPFHINQNIFFNPLIFSGTRYIPSINIYVQTTKSQIFVTNKA